MNKLAERAFRLFKFLAEVQKHNEEKVLTTAVYAREGAAHWVADMGYFVGGEHSRITLGSEIAPKILRKSTAQYSEDPGMILALHRPKNHAYPSIPAELVEWLDIKDEDPSRVPSLKSKTFDSDHSKVNKAFEQWLPLWTQWADAEKYKRLYDSFFDVSVKANQQSDEFELVLGLGNLFWKLSDESVIDRPVFTSELSIEMDKHTGRIEIKVKAHRLTAELDFIPLEEVTDPTFISGVNYAVNELEDDFLREENFSIVGQLTANSLTTDGEYSDAVERIKSDSHPLITWAPCVILRKRRQASLAASFLEIAEEIERTDSVPKGLLPLVDPKQASAPISNSEPGAVHFADGDLFSPLPLNERQRAVIKRVDSFSQTVVQGPPGTGKTHMAAALLSHLLAQGQRVLVTAKTERALYELRGKLPESIRELAVSVIGSGAADKAHLRVAIDTIARRSQDFNPEETEQNIERIENRLAQLGEDRTKAIRKWTSRLESERNTYSLNGAESRLGEIAEYWKKNTAEFSWIAELPLTDSKTPFPLSDGEIRQLVELLKDSKLDDFDALAKADAVDWEDLAPGEKFEELCQEFHHEAKLLRQAQASVREIDLHKWSSFPATKRENAKSDIDRAIALREFLEENRGPWSKSIESAFYPQDLAYRVSDYEHLHELLGSAKVHLTVASKIQSLDIRQGSIDDYVPIVSELQKLLAKGNSIPTRHDGTVKVGFFSNKVIKAAQPFFESVRLNGLPITTKEQCDQFQALIELEWAVEKFRKEWIYYETPKTDSPSALISIWERQLTEYKDALDAYLHLDSCLKEYRQLGSREKFSKVDALIHKISSLLEVDSRQKSLDGRAESFDVLRERVWPTLSAFSETLWAEEILTAIDERDAQRYSTALETCKEEAEQAAPARAKQRLAQKLRSWSPRFQENVFSERRKDTWKNRMFHAEEARQWLLAGEILATRGDDDLVALQEDIRRIDERISNAVTELASERAWERALASNRIDADVRASLTAYRQAANRLGKGTGKYAAEHRRNVRKHLDDCASAVPVWIMPIFKVVEQFKLKENMFDVVIVDEASQASVDAVFLQFLAPRIVVIGDSKQVSPLAVGTSIEPIQRLARQYLHDFRDSDMWSDPKRSLFDEAEMRYGGQITLQEHRRCVPEIIEFSNLISYKPDNIELLPVREVSTGRLAPFRITHTPNASKSPTARKEVNKDEADALILRLLECLDDPAYAGKSFGVISLLGSSGQAEYIQKRLLEKLPTEVWEDRQLKVGSPPEFQGAERDVVFLSMVKSAPAADERAISLLNSQVDNQRMNVAVSRAKDQVWVFHSADIDDFKPDDLRFRLLEYAYRVAQAAPESGFSDPVSDDVADERFDSLFEQRVYNRIAQRGFYVKPQVEVANYRIDLVVQGADCRLAIECDGDAWHSSLEDVRADQVRQRELERLGWTFVRIFESDFYLDKAEAMNKVFDSLERLGIEPYSYNPYDSVDVPDNVEVIDSVAGIRESLASVSDFEPVASVPATSDTGRPVASSSFLEPDTYSETLDNPWATDDVEEIVPSESAATDETRIAEQPRQPELDFPSEEYVYFEGECQPVASASNGELAQGLIDIIAYEGPIVGSLLYTRYVRASEGQRVTKVVRSKLEKALKYLVEKDLIAVSENGDSKDLGQKVYRLLTEAEVRVRLSSDRSLDEIPRNEISAVMSAKMKQIDIDDEEAIMRATLAEFGAKRLTVKVKQILEEIYLELY